jgi:hypothetical protein
MPIKPILPGQLILEEPISSLRAAKMTDEEWESITRVVSLPIEARPCIESEIGFYRLSQAKSFARFSPAKLRKLFSQIQEDASSLLNKLNQVSSDRSIYTAFLFKGVADIEDEEEPHLESLPEYRQFKQLKQSLEELVQLSGTAIEVLNSAKRGPKTGALRFLIERLLAILTYFVVDVKITRSYKDETVAEYLHVICKVADPSMGSMKGFGPTRRSGKRMTRGFGTIDSIINAVVSFAAKQEGSKGRATKSHKGTSEADQPPLAKGTKMPSAQRGKAIR